MSVRYVLPEDWAEVRDLLTACFDCPDEARWLEALRDAGYMRLELVWMDGRHIRGHVGFLRHESPAGWWALSLLAVHARHRRRGVAAKLIRQVLGLTRLNRAKTITVLGKPAYFRSFGFSLKAAAHQATPFPVTCTLLYPIRPGMAGVTADLVYPPELLQQ